MRSLVVEDEITSQILLVSLLEEYGNCDAAGNFKEAIESFGKALSSDSPYDLVCLDIRLPGADGHEILKEIRQIEKDQGIEYLETVKVLMTTALSDMENIIKAFGESCDGYLPKPVIKEKLDDFLEKFDLITK